MAADDDQTAEDLELVAVPRVQLDELVSEVRSLRERVRALEGGEAQADRPAVASDSARDAEPERVGRRRALAGLAGAAVAGTAVALGQGSPAAAANGGNVVLGSDGNAATSPTGIGVQGSSARYGFGVSDNDAGIIVPAPAVFGHAKLSNFDTAVLALAEGGATALFASADDGTAVDGNSFTGSAGRFTSPSTSVPIVLVSSFTDSGSTGVEVSATTQLKLTPNQRTAPPADTIAGVVGQLRWAADGALWGCIAAGTPGTWRRLTGGGTAGQLSVLPAPVRVYDSRPGTSPTSVGPKTKFAAGATRTFDLKVNSSGVPAGATAALVTLLLVNASTTAGNLTVWANGVTKPLSNTMVWGGTAGRFTATAVTALDAAAKVQVNASQPTDLVIDVVGYYR